MSVFDHDQAEGLAFLNSVLALNQPLVDQEFAQLAYLVEKGVFSLDPIKQIFLTHQDDRVRRLCLSHLTDPPKDDGLLLNLATKLHGSVSDQDLGRINQVLDLGIQTRHAIMLQRCAKCSQRAFTCGWSGCPKG